MVENNQYARLVLKRLKEFREQAGLTPQQLEEKLLLGPGWAERYENGETLPDIQTLLALLAVLQRSMADLVRDLPSPTGYDHEVRRQIFAKQEKDVLAVHFTYADHDALYRLPGATKKQYDEVIKTLRDGLALLTGADKAQSEAIKTDAVARAFLKAALQWPQANPSDLWWFVVYRAYCDPFNHPAIFARLDFQQSWKRTGGWALEQVLVRHYGLHLKKNGINLFIASGEEKARVLREAKVSDRLEPDKVDVLLTGEAKDAPRFFGVVHVKASFAERRTDDVPMSRALVEAGYVSPLWTMDCKSTPGTHPINKGELGPALQKGSDRRSAKRKDIEDDGYFSSCFSYNSNTVPTPQDQKCASRIHVCNFRDPDDSFSRFIIAEWQRARHG